MFARARVLAIPIALVAGLALVAGPPGAAPPGAQATAAVALAKDLDRILGDGRLAGASTGLVVRDATTGEVLYTRDSARRLVPASNAKLFTSAAALEVLGPDHRFTTSLHSTGSVRGGVLGGDLYLRGTGDPTMLAADYRNLAAALAAQGVRRVNGDLVTDDTWFDSVPFPPGWAWDDEPYYYSAQTSALTVAPDTDYDAGSITVVVTPGQPGQPATVTFDPPTDYLTVDNTAVTGPAGSASTLTVARDHGTNTVRVRGSVPAGGAAVRQWITVVNPTGLVASLFRAALAAEGIKVTGGTRSAATPAGARQLAAHESMPLSQLLVPFLKLSNNLHAEALVKAMGRKESGAGTWSAGLAAAKSRLAGLGVDTGALSLFDGSGLSRMDNVAPDQIAALLVAAKAKPWFGVWYDALPVAGASDRMVGGTLRNRMAGTPAANNLHAKTGSMTGVTGLSGYVTAASGQTLAFSLVQNNFSAASLKDVEDAVAVRLAGYRGADDTSVAVSVPAQRAAVPADEAATPVRESALECSWTKSC
ncbi:D-alanyl-D-alanine carboxypeptidase/D-alanyl-D-alanine endopeptidase [Goodfellowiella coeruleoviolacea]|uniref:D-alanyl-D-alanine carboxypeptidase / D-alanyl-D-alanine-endopeptidase (Penicillin-binding protein 4) n=1 Tax=Goodfellowiella coeruleoviolacea TaxID=334858 RepID=A0AAE3GFF7_9PSEU|nr:D-alanyl-D-alanine carboxypeptidase/D-alanyl-D-alanine-endopeptidase [Goodfellowiella coeruleoviolacea]MCP2166365.1 D-alanyl-D-alanine carboxypeptidase / D-alanyl-D-alanine-endopeptidase (penicillin-binding protein 4) [Goodfellowiella coeruleoviolacea]